MFIYLCLLQNLSLVCCAALHPPTMQESGQATIIIRPPDTPWPPPPLSPTWTRTPGPWSGSWGSRGRGTGAGWASAGDRTVVTASVSTCGTTWCTCNKRDCVTRDRCDVTRTSVQPRGKCQTQSHSLGSIIFTQKCDCDTRARLSPHQPITVRHLSCGPMRMKRVDNSVTPWQNVENWGAHTHSILWVSGAVTCDELCRKNVPGLIHAQIARGPGSIASECSSLSGVLFAVNLTFDWITVIPIDPDWR